MFKAGAVHNRPGEHFITDPPEEYPADCFWRFANSGYPGSGIESPISRVLIHFKYR